MIYITGDTHIPIDIKKLSAKKFHEQKNLTEEEFCGGKIHKVDEGIYHLMRGMIYNIGGRKIFTFGGESSHDKEYRKEWKSLGQVYLTEW